MAMRSDAASGRRPMDVLDTGMLRWDATGHISAKPLRSANPAITSPAQAFSMGLLHNTPYPLFCLHPPRCSLSNPKLLCSVAVSHCSSVPVETMLSFLRICSQTLFR